MRILSAPWLATVQDDAIPSVSQPACDHVPAWSPAGVTVLVLVSVSFAFKSLLLSSLLVYRALPLVNYTPEANIAHLFGAVILDAAAACLIEYNSELLCVLRFVLAVLGFSCLIGPLLLTSYRALHNMAARANIQREHSRQLFKRQPSFLSTTGTDEVAAQPEECSMASTVQSSDRASHLAPGADTLDATRDAVPSQIGHARVYDEDDGNDLPTEMSPQRSMLSAEAAEATADSDIRMSKSRKDSAVTWKRLQKIMVGGRKAERRFMRKSLAAFLGVNVSAFQYYTPRI